LKRAWLSLAVLGALGCVCPGCPLSGAQNLEIRPSPPLQKLEAFLPDKGGLQNWKAENAPQLYKGEDLYLYIDGGAEIYHEYGFKQVLVQDYKSTAGKSLTLEIFEMADSECAFGIYTFKSSGKGQPIAIGQDGQLEEYYLNFWKGSFQVTLTGFDSSPEVIRGLLLIAKSVDAKIKTQGRRPSLVDIFPEEWLPISRLKYIKGVLGLNNNYSFFARDVFRFREAVMGAIVEGKFTIFVFRYTSQEECRRRYQEVKAAFEKHSSYKNFKAVRPDLFETMDGQGMTIFGQSFADCVTLLLTKESEKSALEIFIVLKKTIHQ
jgi:hypothetical protein